MDSTGLEVDARLGVHFGLDWIPGIFSQVLRWADAKAPLVIVHDAQIWHHYQPLIEAALQSSGFRNVLTLPLEPGEGSKAQSVVSDIQARMLGRGCGRDSFILGIGGGVVTDIVGYAAATYMRGARFGFIPTSLLAMVDASIGGKNGVDTWEGKNLIGTFSKPVGVWIDTGFLRTLPQRELCNGWAEVIKVAALLDPELFAKLEQNSVLMTDPALFNNSVLGFDGVVGSAVFRSAELKCKVVSGDFLDKGLRQILNFGHSVGHGLEAELEPHWLHGECVSAGMLLEAKLTRLRGPGSERCEGWTDILRLQSLVSSFGLPSQVPLSLLKQGESGSRSVGSVVKRMLLDKKNSASESGVSIVNWTGIGCFSSSLEQNGSSCVKSPVIAAYGEEDFLTILGHQVGVTAPRNSPSMAALDEKPRSIVVPGSKSIGLRSILLAALGRGNCVIRGLSLNDDAQRMLDCLNKLGVKLRWSGDDLLVRGNEGRFPLASKDNQPLELFVGNSGITSRFILACLTLAHVPSGAPVQHVILRGSREMHARPVSDLVSPLRALGLSIEYLESPGSLPLRVTVNQPVALAGRKLSVNGSVSSQFVSALMIAVAGDITATLSAQEHQGSAAELSVEDTIITIDSREGASSGLVSSQFVRMTLSCLEMFGLRGVELNSETRVVRFGKEKEAVSPSLLRNPGLFPVPGDASSASYPLAYAALNGSSVHLSNLGEKDRSLQTDFLFVDMLESHFGCVVKRGESSTMLQGPESLPVVKATIDAGPMTDLFSTLAVIAAACAPGSVIEIVNVKNQRVKECNRIQAVATALHKLGVRAEQLPSGLRISVERSEPDPEQTSGIVLLRCHRDHRMTMSFGVFLASRPGFSESSFVLDDAWCVEKTYPQFWEQMGQSFGVQVFPPPRRGSSDSPLVIVGMRGAGKSSLGRLAARRLGLNLVETDCLVARVLLRLLRDLKRGSESGKISDEISGEAGVEELVCPFVLQELSAPDRGSHEPGLFCVLKAFLSGHSLEVVLSVGQSEEDLGKADSSGLSAEDLRRRWELFREVELQCLRQLLSSCSARDAVVCGGGVVETHEAWLLLCQHHPVVEIRRDIRDIVRELELNISRPNLLRSVESSWELRRPLLERSSDLEFSIFSGDSDWSSIGEEWVSLVGKILGRPETRISCRSPGVSQMQRAQDGSGFHSFFVCLTAPDVVSISCDTKEILTGADALEIRADLLSVPQDLKEEEEGKESEEPRERGVEMQDFVRNQIALLRRLSRERDVIFTVRSQSHGGKWETSSLSGRQARDNLLLLAQKLGVAFIDVEHDVPWALQLRLVSEIAEEIPRLSRVLSSVHFPNRLPGSSELRNSIRRCSFGDLVKLVGACSSIEDMERVLAWKTEIPEPWSENQPDARDGGSSLVEQPRIVIGMGPRSATPRVLNRYLSPVTHPLLPVPAAPGQLSVKRTQEIRASLSLLSPRRYCLFGRDIRRSPSPAMHNAGFRFYSLPYLFDLEILDTDADEGAERILQVMRSQGDLHGASVTMPFKESLVRRLHRYRVDLSESPEKGADEDLETLRVHMNPACTEVGAINTLVRLSNPEARVQHWLADNTDWIGIRVALNQAKHRLAACTEQEPSPIRRRVRVALVVGAGGTARAALFALRQSEELGFAEAFPRRDCWDSRDRGDGAHRRSPGDRAVVLWNPRTPARSAELLGSFLGERTKAPHRVFAFPDAGAMDPARLLEVLGLAPGSADPELEIVVNTLPGSARWSLPPCVPRSAGCLVLEAAYLPRDSALALQQRDEGGFVLVRGLSMLLHQGVAQLSHWLDGKPLPLDLVSLMDQAIEEFASQS